MLAAGVDPQAPNTLRVTVDRAGDFSTYTLALIANATTDEPPPGVDPALAQVAFSFKAGCPATGDCAAGHLLSDAGSRMNRTSTISPRTIPASCR